MRQIKYSAPCKIILSGEHAVVYGRPALVSALDLRLSVTTTALSGIKESKKITGIIKEYLLTKKNNFITDTCGIQVTSDIPIGRGLGSSAALSVAASGAIAEYLTGCELSKEEIGLCGHMVEKIFHTNSSGVDTTASTCGGLIYYRKEFDFLKTISNMQFHLPEFIAGKSLLIDTGKPEETTSEMVQRVNRLYNKRTAFTERMFEIIEKITKRCVIAIMKKDEGAYGACLEENEEILERIGVVSERTRSLLAVLKKYGTGKITGAGGFQKGSGYILFYSKKMNELMKYLNRYRISYLYLQPSPIGVRKEL